MDSIESIDLNSIDTSILDEHSDKDDGEITVDTPVSPEEMEALNKKYMEEYGMSYGEFQEKYPPLTMDELMLVLK